MTIGSVAMDIGQLGLKQGSVESLFCRKEPIVNWDVGPVDIWVCSKGPVGSRVCSNVVVHKKN